jgi:hypothetical protein
VAAVAVVEAAVKRNLFWSWPRYVCVERLNFDDF